MLVEFSFVFGNSQKSNLISELLMKNYCLHLYWKNILIFEVLLIQSCVRPVFICRSNRNRPTLFSQCVVELRILWKYVRDRISVFSNFHGGRLNGSVRRSAIWWRVILNDWHESLLHKHFREKCTNFHRDRLLAVRV